MNTIDIQILANTKGLGNVSISKILYFCISNNITTIKELRDYDLSNILSAQYVDKLNNLLESDLETIQDNTEKIIEQYAEHDIVCVSIIDDAYPELLKTSTNPPVLLYCKGNIDLLKTNCVATIGTRENTNIGEKITKKSVDFLVKNNFTIVSGLAKGIDAISHKSALENNGNTIAVLPLVDKIYPAENKQLAQDILNNNGLLISEMKPNTHFHSGQLVKRDRIQSGLSKAIFVIETSINGGSMHATNDAIKLKRFVFTPDIYRFNTKYQNLKQVQGIKILIDSNRSIKYTQDTYEEIIAKLNQPFKKDGLW